MPASTNKQANAAKMAFAYKHGELGTETVSDSVKQMSKMPDEELKKFMSMEETVDPERTKLEQAVENKFKFLGEVINGYEATENQEVIQARNEIMNYIPKIKQELRLIVRNFFEGDQAVGVPDAGVGDLEDDSLNEVNDHLDRLFAKYDLAKYMIQLKENTTGCMAVIDAPQGMLKRKAPKTVLSDTEESEKVDISAANQLDKKGELLKESEGGSFEFTYKLDDNWFKKYQETHPAYEFYYDKEDRIYMVYNGDNHILTYNTANNNVFTDENIQSIKEEYSPEEHEKVLKEQIENLTGKKIILI